MSINEHDTLQNEPLETMPEAEDTAGQSAPEQDETEAPAVEETQVSDLEKEVEQLKAQQKETTDRYLRTLAEYDNYRKRSQKEKESIYSEAKAATVAALLPIYDNLERALKQETEDTAFYKGVEMTMNECRAVFEKLGVTELPALGQPFDPMLHNAVMHVEDESVGESTVVEVFQTGFALGDRVIRCAMVKVAN